jgi:RNA polymerase primary sigma factor
MDPTSEQSTPVDRVLRLLLDDAYRMGGSLARDHVDRVMDRRGLPPEERVEVLARLEDNGFDVAEADSPEGFEGRPLRAPGESDAYVDALGEYFDDISSVSLLTAEEEVVLGRRIRLGAEAAQRLGEGADDPRLVKLVETGEEAKNELVLSNLRLVVHWAKPYAAVTGMDLLDLVQEGSFGLLRAVEKFDYTLGYKFSTYATWWIRQTITRGLADKGRMIRLPVHVQDSLSRIRKAQRKLTSETGQEPSLQQLAEHLEMEPATIQFLLDAERQVVSLDEAIVEDGRARGEFLAGGVDGDPYHEVEESERRRVIGQYLSHLSHREKDVIIRRFGLIDGRRQTLEEIGEIYGVTRERIRQIEVKALGRLRDQPDALGLKEFS